jgi:hypothetical protein
MPASTSLVGWILKPVSRLIVGLIAIPLLRTVRRRIPRMSQWDAELEKDVDQWFRASLLLLFATKNAEIRLMNGINAWLEASERMRWDEIDLNQWYITAGRLLLAISVVESMPDQDLFSIIHPGPRWRYDRACSLAVNARRECWPLCRGLLCQHLNRTSPMFAILSVFFGGAIGWVFYGMAIAQYLAMALVTTRDRALDVLLQYDRAVSARRDELVAEFLASPADDDAPQPAAPPASPRADETRGDARARDH